MSVLLAKLSIKMSNSRSESDCSRLLKCPTAGNPLLSVLLVKLSIKMSNSRSE